MMMTIMIDTAMAPRRASTDIKMDTARGSNRDGMKAEKTILKTSVFLMTARPAADIEIGWAQSGCIRMLIAMDIARGSERAITIKAALGVMAMPTTFLSCMAATTAGPGQVIEPTRLVFEMAHQ